MATASLIPGMVRAAEVMHSRQLARESLLAFTEATHPRWETGEHHLLLCEWLEKLERGDISNLAVFAPPRHGKTELVSRRFPAWCMGRHPEWQMICAQATGLLAADTGADVREILRSPEFRRIFPGVELRADAQAAGRWLTDAGGVYFAAGCDGTIIGRGANLLDIDDPHRGRQDADSERMRNLTGNWYFGDALFRLMTPARQLLTQTRWHEDDLSGRIIPHEREWEPTDHPKVFKAGDWHVIRLRAIEQEGTKREVALWPGANDDRFPLRRLHEIKTTLTKAGKLREWRAQYQQSPTADEGTYIQRAWFSERWEELPWVMNVYIASDYAVTDKKDSPDPDWTEHGVFGMTPDDRIYVLDWVGGQWTPDVWIERLLDLTERYKPYAVFGTKGVIRNSIEPFLKKRMRERKVSMRMEWLSDMADKSAKGRAFQAAASSSRILFPVQSEWAERIIDQCVGFPSVIHDDGFDTMSNICRAIDQAHPAIVRHAPGNGNGVDRYAGEDHGRTTWAAG